MTTEAKDEIDKVQSKLDEMIRNAPEGKEEPLMESDSNSSRDETRGFLRKSGFPERHINAFLGGVMEGPGKAKAEKYRERVAGGDCLLVLCGDRGTGKTQIATSWGAEFGPVNKGDCFARSRARYFRAQDLMVAIRGEFSDQKELFLESRETIKAAKSCEFLVIDEYSELAGSPYEFRILTNILDYRYGEMKSTVIITNTQAEKVPDEVGRSVYSRCVEQGGIINCDWQTYRKTDSKH